MRYFLACYIFVLIFVLGTEDTYSQIEYRQGFVINHTQDTVNGMLSIKKTNQYYKYCYFKAHNSNKIKKYSANEIVAFGIEESLCFVSIQPKNNEQVFAQLLVAGKCSLLKTNHQYYIVKGKRTYQLDADFKKVLGEILLDCKKIKYDILLAKKEDVELSRLIENYNECMGSSSITYHYQPSQYIITPSLGFGIYSSELISTINNRNGDESTSSGTCQDFQGGINVDLMITKFSTKFSFSLGLYYMQSSYVIDIKQVMEPRYSHNPTETVYEETQFSYASVQVPIMIKYNIPIDLWNVYLGAGITNNFNFNSTYNTTYELESEQVVNTNTVSGVSEIKKTEQGIVTAIGIDRMFRKGLCIGGELRAELGNGVFKSQNDYYSLNSNTRKIYATLYYKF